MKTIARFFKLEDAHILLMKLEDAGIKAILIDHNITTVAPYLSLMTGGMRVQVTDDDFQEAVDLLQEEYDSTLNLRENISCPSCGSENIAQELNQKGSSFFALLMLLFMIPASVIKIRYSCNQCNHLWNWKKR